MQVWLASAWVRKPGPRAVPCVVPAVPTPATLSCVLSVCTLSAASPLAPLELSLPWSLLKSRAMSPFGSLHKYLFFHTCSHPTSAPLGWSSWVQLWPNTCLCKVPVTDVANGTPHPQPPAPLPQHDFHSFEAVHPQTHPACACIESLTCC